MELCLSFGCYVAVTKSGILHDGTLQLSSGCCRHFTYHWSKLCVIFSFYNLDLFDKAMNVGYIAHHFIVHSLDNIIVYYGLYNDS